MMRLVTIAWQTVSRQRLRSLLTAVSLILGVMALTSVAAAQDVMRETIIRNALLTGGPTVTSAVTITDDTDPVGTAARWADSLSLRYGDRTETARVLSPNTLTLSADGAGRPDIEIFAVDPSFTTIRPLEVTDGVWLDRAPHTLAPNIVLNEPAATQYGNTLHWTLRWGTNGQQTTAIRVGTVDDGSTSPTTYLDLAQAGAPRDAALRDGTMTLHVHADGVTDTALKSTLHQIGQIADLPAQIGDVRRTDTVNQLDTELSTTARIFIAIAVVALAIAAVGMLNIGLSTLAERSDELSLRRAFGAHRRDIIILMLLEAQIVAITAGLVGVATSYVTMPFTLIAFGATSTTTAFPLGAALAGVAAGSVAALAGAVTPAFRAMSTPIASIMRG